jgi:hypothetical protein
MTPSDDARTVDDPMIPEGTSAPAAEGPAAEGPVVDPTVDQLARAIDPPGRRERIRGTPGRAVARVTSWPVEAWVSLMVVAACSVFVFLQLGPSNIFSDSTPAGGDMGAHVWGPAFMRDHLLPSFRLTGWTPDWYAGMPAYHFYMVLPSLAIALLSYLVPYGIAFKLVAISGLVSLPISAWAFGRLTRLPFPGPPLLAIGATAFLFDRSFSILGGNLASTMAGEFAFSISLSFALLFLGVVGRGMDNGRHRVLAAVLLALTGLTHLIPFLFVIGASLVWILVSVARRTGIRTRIWWLFSAGVVGSALTMWWLLPFYLRSPYMNDMGWEKRTNYVDLLFRRENLDAGLVDAPRIEWVLVLAFLGLVMSIAWRRRTGAFLALTAVGVAIAFVVVPQGRLWNARLLPFFYLSLYLLAAIGIAELGRTVATLVARDPTRPTRAVTVVTAVAAWVVVIVMLALPLRALPGGSQQADGSYKWLFLSTTESSFVSAWARWNFSGYENKPAYPEYQAIVATMAELGETDGCGRAMWEHEPEHDRYGTPMALMLLPFWTDGCIGSMEGLFFESSSTTPYHFLMQDELSTSPSNAQRDLPYAPGAPTPGEFDIGVQHMQLLGVRYYMAISDGMIEKAEAHPDLTEVARSGPWAVFLVADRGQVVVLDNQPAVVTGIDASQGWLDAVVPWYEDPDQWSVFLAADGPAEWPRIAPGEVPPEVATEPVAVTGVDQGTDTISFEVSRPGTPVLVKTSYFPNWTAEGADGPWRISPNLMVVVPTDTEVTLRYGTTAVDWLGWAVTAAGLVGLVLLWRAGPLVLPAAGRWSRGRDDGPDGPDGPDGEEAPGPPVTGSGVVAPGVRRDDATSPPDGRPARSGDGVPATEFDPTAVIVGATPPVLDGPSAPDVPTGSDEQAAPEEPSGPDAPDPGSGSPIIAAPKAAEEPRQTSGDDPERGTPP